MEEILSVIDNFERALETETADEAYKKGVEVIVNASFGGFVIFQFIGAQNNHQRQLRQFRRDVFTCIFDFFVNVSRRFGEFFDVVCLDVVLQFGSKD